MMRTLQVHLVPIAGHEFEGFHSLYPYPCKGERFVLSPCYHYCLVVYDEGVALTCRVEKH